jgi:sugar lactone lactonase YvrE
MKRLLLLASALLLIPATALAQDGDEEWTFDGIFPADSNAVVHGPFGAHGMAVDPEGKVWVGGFYDETEFVVSEDTINTTGVFVFNPDGTQTDFSPITSITVDGDQDTLIYTSDGFPYSTRGMTSDQNGNIILATSGYVYRLNYETGEGMNKLVGPRNDEGGIISLADPAVAEGAAGAGSIYLSRVAGGHPIEIYTSDFENLGQVTDSRAGFSRGGAVTDDGAEYYQNMYTQDMTVRYASDAGPFGDYSKEDTVLKGMATTASAFNDSTGNMWVNAGGNGQAPNEYMRPDGSELDTDWGRYSLYAYNPETGEVVDSTAWNNAEVDGPIMRDIALSSSGDTMYVANFRPGAPSVQRFVRGEGSAIDRTASTPDALTLSDNAPNPFSRSTRITFTLHEPARTTLAVYDVLGRKVRTLVDRQLPAGTEHSARFRAESLPSGVYFYRLQAGGHQLTGKMVLAK